MNYNIMPLKYFVDVAQTHGFISAAKRNYVSETAVSSAISKLEKELGQKLINRNSGVFSLTPVGKEFYKRAVVILKTYNEIWHHPELPSKLLRIHFLEGMASDAALFASHLPHQANLSFDEETFNQSISRLLNSDYDLLVAFELAFINNAKVDYLPLRKIDFDLLFNVNEVKKFNHDLKKLTSKSDLYLQYWQSTGISDIQSSMLRAYGKNNWTWKQVIGVNSFEAACLNVNYSGGFTMVPETFNIPAGCRHIYRMTPKHLKKRFRTVIAFNKNIPGDLKRKVKKAISESYH